MLVRKLCDDWILAIKFRSQLVLGRVATGRVLVGDDFGDVTDKPGDLAEPGHLSAEPLKPKIRDALRFRSGGERENGWKVGSPGAPKLRRKHVVGLLETAVVNRIHGGENFGCL